MKNRIVKILAVSALGAALLAGCTNKDADPVTEEPEVVVEENDELTFEDLQANYQILSECYEKTEELYLNPAVAQDDNIEKLLNEARGIIDEMGTLKEDDFETPEDMSAFNDTMADMIDNLSAVIDQMQPAVTDEEESEE